MKVHFIGVGGIGVSALAQYYLGKGHQVSGSDLIASEITDYLKEKGINIFIGEHRAENSNADLVIYSPAVKKDNPELKGKCLSYPQALGELTKEHYTIAVSGTHGKSTVSSMIGLAMAKAGLDPTVIVGTKVKEFNNSNFRKGNSKYLVIEADEWAFSFLNYWPEIVVLNNIEKEHLDCYKNMGHILKTYKQYISHVPENGHLVVNKDDRNIGKIIDKNLKVRNIHYFSKKDMDLQVPGDHNLYNAQACLLVCRILNIPEDIAIQSLSEYKGVWRRFEQRQVSLNNNPFTLISDYGHHPTEVEATIKGTKEKFPNKDIWLIFQPHQYQRTYYLFNDFVKVFKRNKDIRIMITDIFDVAGRENRDINKKVDSQRLAKKSGIQYIEKDKMREYLEQNIKGNEVVIIMGAGNIYTIAEEL